MNNLYTFNVPLPQENLYRKKIENYSFSLSDKIGKGYSSVVYKGLNDITNQIVAIKVIDLKSLQDDIARKMLESELQCLKNLNHMNLLRCYDSYSTVNNCYIITQYCNDGDMASQLKKKHRYSEDQFMKIFREIFLGYKNFVELGYIHRDLKPANLLVKDKMIKIADFGFVKKNTGPQKESYNVGTPLYMSPESSKENIYTVKSDIWSIGVLSYELLAGTAPWECRSESELKEKIFRNNIRYDHLNISRELKDLLSRCLQIQQHKRIGLQQIQTHPWVKKIMAPKIMPKVMLKFDIKSQSVPVGENKENINLLNVKEHQNMVAVKGFEHHENPQRSTLKSKSLEILISMLNLCRFYFKLHKIATESSLGLEYTAQLCCYLKQELHNHMDLHDIIVNCKENIINSKDWDRFIASPQWQKYESVVGTYAQKYNPLFMTNTQYYHKDLVKYIKDAQNKIQSSEVLQNDMKNLILLDYLVTCYQLVLLLERSNRNYEQFAQESQIDRIMTGKVEEGRSKKLVFYNIKQKIVKLEL